MSADIVAHTATKAEAEARDWATLGYESWDAYELYLFQHEPGESNAELRDLIVAAFHDAYEQLGNRLNGNRSGTEETA